MISTEQELAARNAELERLLAKQADAIASFETKYATLHAAYMDILETCKKLERGILSQRGRERLSVADSQLTLGILGSLFEQSPPAQEPSATATEPAKERSSTKPSGRRPIPANIPRIEIVVDPPEIVQDGLDQYEVIGEEVSETIERRASSLVVVRVVRRKFVRKDRDRLAEVTVVSQAVPVESPIPKGLAGPGFLADTIVKRWDDHQPLHRLERVYGRDGIDINRSTICGWHTELSTLIQPLINAMWKDAKESPYLCTDATGVLVLQKEKCANGHFWVLIAPGAHVLFAFSRDHDSAAVDRLLSGYKGTLVADAHSVYDHLYRKGDILESNCWAHLRRYVYKALGSDRVRALEPLALINRLFEIERQCADLAPHARLEVRTRDSLPVVDEFYNWCVRVAPTLVEHSPLARAVTYATNQVVGLRRFLSDGRLPIHNNASERELRREACGRNNWMFLGSDNGGQVNANFVSLLASCRLHGIEPWAYLRDLFCLLPAWPASRVLDLAPAYWKQTLQNDDTQQRLAASVFRSVTVASQALHANAV